MSRRTVVLSLLLLVLSLPVAVIGLIASEAGSRWLLDLASRMAGDRVAFEHVSGTLLSPLELAQIEYREDAQRVSIQRMSLVWRPSGLLNGTAHLERLALKQVSYRAGPGDQPPAKPDRAFGGIRLPVAVRADEVTIEHLDIRQGTSRHPVAFVQLRDFRADNHTLSFSAFEVKGAGYHMMSRGRMAVKRPYALEAAVTWSYRLPRGTTASGSGELSGNLDAIEVTHRLQAPFAATLAGTVRPLATPPRLDLQGHWQDLQWPLQGPGKTRSDSGKIRLRGSADALRVMLDASINAEGLPLDRIQVDADGGFADNKIRAAFRWTAGLVQGGEASGRGRVTGDTARLALAHTIEEPVRLSTRGDVVFADGTVNLALGGDWRDLGWPLAGDPVFTSASGRYRLDGPLDRLRYSIDGALRSPAARIARANVTLAGHAAARAPFAFDAELDWKGTIEPGFDAAGRATIAGDVRRIEIDSVLERPFSMETRGEVMLDPDPIAVRLTGHWRDLQWPLSGAPRYVSSGGEFTLLGPIHGLDLTSSGDFGGPELPAARARLNAHIQASGANIRSLLIETPGGDIRVRGDVGWRPIPTWQVDVKTVGFNPEFLAVDWPGDVSINATVSGALEGNTPRVGIELKELKGRLRGHPVHGRGSLEIDGARVAARNLALRSGENTLRLEGEASDALAIRFDIDAPSLDAFAPQLGGSLKGSGALGGTRTQPQISAGLSGADIAWGKHRMQTLSLDLDAGADPEYRSKIALDARGIRIGDSIVEQITLDGAGTPGKHRLRMTALAPVAKLTAAADGSLVDDAWRGNVDAGLSTRHFGDWRFEQPAPVRAGRDGVSLERTCLVQQPAAICAEGEWRAANGAISAGGEILSLPLALAKPFLPEGVRIEGPLAGEFSLGGRLGAAEGSVRLLAQNGTIAYRPGSDFPPAEFRIQNASLEASRLPSGAQIELGVVLENAGRLQGNLDMGISGKDGSAPLRGRVEAQFSDLAWLGVLTPRTTDVRGALSAELDVGGTTAHPAVTGEAVLRDGQVNLPDLGLALRDINLNLRNETAERYVIEGGLISGGGRIDLLGQSDLGASGQRHYDLSLKGQDFEVARLPSVQAYASPDLRLRAQPDVAELTGQIHIPKATIKLKQLPESAVTVSGDEVIVGKDTAENDSKRLPGPRTRIMVDLSLGDAVSFEGFGLYAGVGGNLALSGESGQLPNARGVLSLREGRYDAFGQKLDIERGRLLFTGPVDNPGIDVTAVRKIREITAGIAISGNVKSIRSRVFSDPTMPEADAFSYLLTGRPLSGGSKSDAEMLSGAALSLGLQRSQLITRQIGATFGLDELSVGGDDVAHSSLLLGKQLTPDLFVRYALGLFEQTGKLLLNYRLTDSLSLEAESGEQQGVDLIYQIERDKLF